MILSEGQDPADSIAASYSVDIAGEIDTLEDIVKERLARIKSQNPSMDLDELAKTTAEIIEETIKAEKNSRLMRTKRNDTIDEALLAIAINRSPESLASLAKRYINPATGKPYTRAALSARLTELTQRTGLVLRIQRSERVREIYKQRALRIHKRRREECPKWDKNAWLKGLKLRGKKK